MDSCKEFLMSKGVPEKSIVEIPVTFKRNAKDIFDEFVVCNLAVIQDWAEPMIDHMNAVKKRSDEILKAEIAKRS